jgi:hypothetical protein
MTVKLNHYYSINPLKMKEYKKFMLRSFIPGINRLNVHAVAGWAVMVGAYSEIIFESVASDLDLLETALRDPNYIQLKNDLLYYIKGYKTKVLVERSEKETYSTDIRSDTVKFNQTWDPVTDRKDEYERFTKEEFFPLLEELGIQVAGNWEVLIGDGPRVICEGRATNVDQLIGNLQGQKFRKARIQLKGYVENYSSRLLAFHILKVKGYKSASYEFVSE